MLKALKTVFFAASLATGLSQAVIAGEAHVLTDSVFGSGPNVAPSDSVEGEYIGRTGPFGAFSCGVYVKNFKMTEGSNVGIKDFPTLKFDLVYYHYVGDDQIVARDDNSVEYVQYQSVAGESCARKKRMWATFDGNSISRVRIQTSENCALVEDVECKDLKLLYKY